MKTDLIDTVSFPCQAQKRRALAIYFLGKLLKNLGAEKKDRLMKIRPLGGKRWIDCFDIGYKEVFIWYDMLLSHDDCYTTSIASIKLPETIMGKIKMIEEGLLSVTEIIKLETLQKDLPCLR